MDYKWERPKSRINQFFDKFKERPKTSNLLIILLISLVVFGILQIVIFQPIESSLKTSSGFGVLDLEFAWTPEMMQIILDAWQVDGRSQEIVVTILDFIYLACYSLFISGLILLVARKLRDRFQEIELKFILIPILAGFFDVIENIFLLIMLGSGQAVIFLFPLITSICATIKFILIYTAVICFAAGIIGILLYHYEVI